jgi:acyl-CoA hydrolase
MAKFNVNVVRIGYASMDIEVEADTEELAKEKALDAAGNLLFSEHSSEYEAESVVRGPRAWFGWTTRNKKYVSRH